MSKNEMVSVPSGWLYRINPDVPGSNWQFTQDAEHAESLARSENVEYVKLPAEQHQGEPVDALLLDDCIEHKHPGYGVGCFGTEIVKLYTHADAGEVERLRAALELEQEATAKWQETAIQTSNKLAGRDALLRVCLDWFKCHSDGVTYEIARDGLIRDIGKVLSASAKPSAPVGDSVTDDTEAVARLFGGEVVGAEALLEHREEMLKKIADGWKIFKCSPDMPLSFPDDDCGLSMAFSIDDEITLVAVPPACNAFFELKPYSTVSGIYGVSPRIEYIGNEPWSITRDPSSSLSINITGNCILDDGGRAYEIQQCEIKPVESRCVIDDMAAPGPVERDERAEFEKRFGNCTWGEDDYANEQRGWEARAALERKS